MLVVTHGGVLQAVYRCVSCCMSWTDKVFGCSGMHVKYLLNTVQVLAGSGSSCTAHQACSASCQCRHVRGHEYKGKFSNCALNTLWIDGGTWTLGVWGDIAHLNGVGAQTEAFGGGMGG